jgi:hypothetical protein
VTRMRYSPTMLTGYSIGCEVSPSVEEEKDREDC